MQSIAADNLVVMSSPGEIRGSFEAACQLVLETMSAYVLPTVPSEAVSWELTFTPRSPITANVTMRNGDQNLQATIRLNTGNA